MFIWNKGQYIKNENDANIWLKHIYIYVCMKQFENRVVFCL